MLYVDVQAIITTYAPEMLPDFADRFSRWPQGGTAATIVNYLNDRATFWYNFDATIAKRIAEAAAEIISREQ